MTRVEAIRARLVAATPGPWKAQQSWYHEASGIGAWNVTNDQSVLIREQTLENAQLIAHAPQDLRLLMELYDALKEYFRVFEKPLADFEAMLPSPHPSYLAIKAVLSRLDSPVGNEGAGLWTKRG